MLCFLQLSFLSNSSFAFMAGHLTILLYFLAFVLYAFTLHPEEAECAGHNSGAHIGEQLLTKDSLSFSAFSWMATEFAGNGHHCML